MPSKLLTGQIGLLSLLFFSPAATAASDPNSGWVEVRTAHFTVATNAGEKEGRRIAGQFEQIRTMFQSAFPKFRVDPAQPIAILAAKNENTMKLLIPEDWAAKGHVHHAGMYQQGEDKHYVIMRLDAEGDNPYHTLYHEYTHALLHLNFGDLPLWLDEGLAEFFGNSTLGAKESRVGTIDQAHLYILGQNKLIPVDVLLQVDHSSPYYNEANRTSVFYAESWALIHYLMLDAEARQKQLLTRFLSEFDRSGNQLEAAKATFGDLKVFGQGIEPYARQSSFMVGTVKNTQAEDTNVAVRPLEPGETLALRGDYFSHTNQLTLAKPALEQALQLAPNVPLAHEAMGYYDYRKQDLAAADQEMERAIDLGSRSFVPFYYHGFFLAQNPSVKAHATQDAIASLQKAMQMNPQFAAAFEALAHVYTETGEMQKAVSPAFQAVKLEPYWRPYRVNFAYVLMNNNRDADARIVAQQLLKAATTPEETNTAQEVLSRVAEHEQWAAQVKAAGGLTSKQTVVITSAAPSGAAQGPGSTGARSSPGMAVEGAISSVDCAHSPEALVTVQVSLQPMTFHLADFHHVAPSPFSKQTAPQLQTCEALQGQSVRLWFRLADGKDYLGEVSAIDFLQAK